VDKQSLAQLIKAGESETLEFKEQWTDSSLETLSTFANQQGGKLLIGVADNGNIKGWKGDEADLEGLINKISDLLHIHPSVTLLNIDNLHVVNIEVMPAGVPVACRGRYYKRMGSTTREMTAAELGQFFISKMGVTWDSIPTDYESDDFDHETVSEFIVLARNRLPRLNESEPLHKLLEKLELVEGSKPTRGAIMLFGRNPQRHFTMSGIHMGRFKTATTILDDKLLRGNIFQLLEQAMRLFQQYQQVRFEIKGKYDAEKPLKSLQRKETWQYPLDALREALLNALLHRDYFVTSSEIAIKVFDDSILISNPGALQQDMTIEELKQENHRSILRNPRMAQVLYFASMIERWGSGTTRMIDLCKQNGLPAPEFNSRGGWFDISFMADRYNLEQLKRLGLKERQMQAIIHAKKEGLITRETYEKLADVSKATAAREIAELLEKGILAKSEGKGRGTYYILSVSKPSQSSHNRLTIVSNGSNEPVVANHV